MKQYLVTRSRVSKAFIISVFSAATCLVLVFWFLQQPTLIPENYSTGFTVTELTENAEISGLGVIYPREKTIISAPVAGYVKQLHLRQGQLVKQGDLLLELANDELQQELTNSRYDFQNVQANVAIKTVELEERSFQLQTQLTRAEAEYEKQKLELDARRTLLASGVVSSIQFQQSELSARQAEAEVILLKKQLKNFSVGKNEQLQALQSQLIAAKHRTDYLQQRLSQLSFFAEKDATISKLELSRGQSVQQGQELLEWIEREQLIARINLPQHTAGQIRSGLNATVNTPFGPVSAVVSYINPVVKAGAYQVELELKPHELPLAVDQDVEAFIQTDDKRTRLVVNKPYGFQKDDWKVYLKKGNQATLINLNIAQQNQDTLFLDSSLSAGDTLWFIPAQLANNEVLRLPDAS